MTEPSPRFAVVTGCTKGIGRAIALRLAQAGLHIIGCSRHAGDLASLQTEIDQHFPQSAFYSLVTDMAAPRSVQSFAEFVLTHTAAPTILVNNAGLFAPGSVLEDEEGHLEHMMAVNLFSVYHLTRRLAPSMVASGSGHIFNLGSVASLQAYPGGSTYAITKFAVLGFSRSLRAELRETGVRVTTLLPGATWSASWDGADLPADRLMAPEDIAELVWTAYSLKSPAVVEEILVRPQLGDL